MNQSMGIGPPLRSVVAQASGFPQADEPRPQGGIVAQARMTRSSRTVAAISLSILLSALLTAPAGAQEICGDGTTFTVSLPSVSGGAGDSVTLPRGCRVYALLVSGYERNGKLDELTFYRLAKFVTENNGYVHWAWWNNLLKEYLAGPLHRDETFTNPLTGRVIGPTPGGLIGVHAAGFVPLFHELDIVPKAVPEDDFQFQADASRMLAAVRAENPGALILVAGHSMGGSAVARLGANTPVDIDLLAPIDPVGNRSSPVGRPTVLDPRPDRTFNWTRWRATREFRGFRIRDCVRNGLHLCENFGTFFRPQFRCTTVGPLLAAPPPFPGSLAPVLCPGPWVDPGTRLQFGGRVKRLYHRWQNETLFPFDYETTEYFSHWALRNAGGATEAVNFQAPAVTCAIGFDPRDPSRWCNPTDGHGEIVGFRFPTPGRPNPPGPNVPVAPLALQALSWPQFDDTQSSAERAILAAQRRELFLEMPTANDDWSHRPIDPDLDLVSGDMVIIVQQLLASQPTSELTTVATATPGPNVHGWNNEDVVVTLAATAGPGREVREIEFSLAGAESAGPATHHGNSVDVTISAEGETTITFFARDDGWNVEDPRQLTVRVDKTPPSVIGQANPGANAGGWNNSDVTVTFSAEDALSGIETVDPPVMITGEGTGLEATGTATDYAGNTSAAVVTVNIDRTPPVVNCDGPDGAWHGGNVALACTGGDGLSGLSNVADAEFALATSVPVGTETADAATDSRAVCDNAGNCVSAGPVGGNWIDRKAPEITLNGPEAVPYLLHQVVPASYACADGGSGVASCAGPMPSGTPIETGAVGGHAFMVTAHDAVGNSAVRSVQYSVVYDFRGFFGAIGNPPAVNDVDAGRAVALQFSLGGDQGVAILAPGYPASRQVACDATSVSDAVAEPTAAEWGYLTYKAHAAMYQYAWKTQPTWAGTCRQLNIRLADGTNHLVMFRIR